MLPILWLNPVTYLLSVKACCSSVFFYDNCCSRVFKRSMFFICIKWEEYAHVFSCKTMLFTCVLVEQNAHLYSGGIMLLTCFPWKNISHLYSNGSILFISFLVEQYCSPVLWLKQFAHLCSDGTGYLIGVILSLDRTLGKIFCSHVTIGILNK